jgi:hypothetical protein
MRDFIRWLLAGICLIIALNCIVEVYFVMRAAESLKHYTKVKFYVPSGCDLYIEGQKSRLPVYLNKEHVYKMEFRRGDVVEKQWDYKPE